MCRSRRRLCISITKGESVKIQISHVFFRNTAFGVKPPYFARVSDASYMGKHSTYLSILLEIYGLTRPVLNDQLGQLHR